MMDIELLLNQTKCARAQKQVRYEDGIPYMSSVHCTKDKKICEVCKLWQQSDQQIDQMVTKRLVDHKILEILNKAAVDETVYRGRNCMKLGDVIITLETVHCEGTAGVCSSNQKDFSPICKSVGVELVVPDYSWKK